MPHTSSCLAAVNTAAHPCTTETSSAAAITPTCLCLQERDPRWLVDNRHDGTNVNGWHWQDKNRFAWAKEKLEQALPELPPAETGNVRISKVTDVVGEVRRGQADPSDMRTSSSRVRCRACLVHRPQSAVGVLDTRVRRRDPGIPPAPH